MFQVFNLHLRKTTGVQHNHIAAYLRKQWSPNAHSLSRCKFNVYIGQLMEVEFQLFHSGNDTFHEWHTYIGQSDSLVVFS